MFGFYNTNLNQMEKQMNIKRAFLILIAAMLMPGLAMAQDGPITTLNFNVTKEFTDGNPGSIEVTILCDTGIPLEQKADITELDGVTFVVAAIPDIDLIECVITEDVGAGYNAIFSANDLEPGIGGGDACTFNGSGGFDNIDPILNTCEIINSMAPVAVAISKTWVDDRTDSDQGADIMVRSDAELVDGEWCDDVSDDYCLLLEFDGDDSDVVWVVPHYGLLGSLVSITEQLDDSSSSIDSHNGCGGHVRVYAATGSSCAITNTVFFEGIPTLNQYGLAILAVLMLGVGFVGFRRFV